MVERERADARGPGLVARFLFPTRPELLPIEERVVEHDGADGTDAAVPEVGDQPVETLGRYRRIAAALHVQGADPAVFDRLVREIVGGEAVLRTEAQQSRGGCHQLGIGSGIEEVVRIARVDDLPVIQRLHLERHTGVRERRLREQLLDRLAQRLTVGLPPPRRKRRQRQHHDRECPFHLEPFARAPA